MSDNIKNEVKAKTEKKLVPLNLPLTYDEEIDSYPVTISLNFKTYAVRRGETVMVPPAVKKIIEDQEEARKKAYRYSLAKSLSANEKKFKQENGLED